AHNESCFEFVWYMDETYTIQASGINRAVANISIGNFDAETLTRVLENLTVKDFIDDGILDLSEVEGKLCVLFCEHGATVTDFVVYTHTHPGATYRDYLDSIHTDDDAEYLEDLNAWQSLPIKNFIENLVSKL
ncbi:MAG: hypothetical protein J6R37_02465, partial [Clostridia bacterium]|nr:hypothetical protein [Clostridia bacterium]